MDSRAWRGIKLPDFRGSPLLDRRQFLSSTASGIVTSLALRGSLLAQLQNVPPLPERSLLESDEEAFWAAMRRQFIIPEDEIYLNNGTVGSSPVPVLRAILDGYTTTEKLDQQDPEDYPIWGYAAWNEFRDPLAQFVGCTRDEIALLRNATEANSYIANGIDMKPGDEVLMTDQEHPGGEHPWDLKAKRYGIVVKKVTLPRPVKDAAQVLNLINDAITPRTRVLFFSHITTFSGVVLPAKELAALARSKGILSAVDGAHVPGMMRLDVHDLGCDMYSSSPHKWLMAPKGSGFLYVRDEVIDRLWNTIATEGWNDTKIRADRFQRIESRHRNLADYILDEMKKRGAESWTSPDPALRCAIVTVNVPPVPRMDLENWLWKTHKVRIRGGDPNKLRLSTPYYLQKKDIDRFLDKFDEYKKMNGIS